MPKKPFIHYDLDAQGVATLTWEVHDRPENVLHEAALATYATALERALGDAAVKGIVIASARPAFLVGADLAALQRAQASSCAQALFDANQALQALLRRQETGGKLVVAALGGSALGAGLELALAAHRRLVADDPTLELGLTQVNLGLMPEAGGTQRLPRLLGIRPALELLTQGRTLSPHQALELGLVDEVVPPRELLLRAKALVLEHQGQALQPWDTRGFRPPGGGVQSPAGYETFIGGAALLTRQTWGVYPAPEAILASVYHGMQMPLDQALKYEGRQAVNLLQGPVAKTMLRTLHFGLHQANTLATRPTAPPTRTFATVGVLGAGMMGTGLAHVFAQAGLKVVWIDQTLEGAQTAKQRVAALLQKDLERGKLTPEAMATTLERIHPTTDYGALGEADLVVEAVFEDPKLKADLIARAEAVLSKDAIVASNTSTLPITELAKASARPQNFLGLHFFSPVHKMPLVEIIEGRDTSQKTTAEAMDFVKQIQKTPVVVGDGRGFFTSRVFSAYVKEGIAMVKEGIHPVLIERAARMAGMAVGPLAVADEVSLELMDQIEAQAHTDPESAPPAHPATEVVRWMVHEQERLGKKVKAGFYDYPEAGTKRLWPGLLAQYPRAGSQPTAGEVGHRLLQIQGLEAARALEEGVVRRPGDADLASVLGWGFAPQHGGVLSFIQTVGVEDFVAHSARCAQTLGPRFLPPALLTQMAAKGQVFFP